MPMLYKKISKKKKIVFFLIAHRSFTAGSRARFHDKSIN